MRIFNFNFKLGLLYFVLWTIQIPLLAGTRIQPPCLPAPTLTGSSVTHICAGQSANLVLMGLTAGQEAVWYDDPTLSNVVYQSAANAFHPAPSATAYYYGVVFDNMMNCYSDALPVTVTVGGNIGIISGNVQTEVGEGIAEATVTLSGPGIGPYTTLTNNLGNYIFTGLPVNADYTIRVELDQNPLNGVSSFDLVLTNKHILGIEYLNSPYKIIACDVNGNGVISVADILETRMLILGIITEFITAPSWRFVPADFVFPDPTHPFLTTFPLGYKCVHLDCVMGNQDFIGMKTADANLTAVAN